MKPAAQSRPNRASAWRPLGIAILLSLLFHTIGSLVFTVRAVTQTRAQFQPPLVTFLSPTADAPSIEEFRKRIALADPSASSLPNLEGYSHTTIRRLPVLPSLIEMHQSDPQFLGRPRVDPKQVIIVAAPTVAELLLMHATKQPSPAVDLEEAPVPFVLLRESSFLLSGPIKDRRLLSLVNIPTVRSPAPPQPTVVRICVSPVGEAKFAVIEKGSGADDKDARAIDIIRRWRFLAVPDVVGDQWGTVSVYWAAEPVAPPAPDATATNALPAANPEP
ncbi:MAG: hypothetical protein EXS18_07350 [Verrucomicrobiae bacterium]|nr:hypothetical protein [Verrucomicrobiae bacterium]